VQLCCLLDPSTKDTIQAITIEEIEDLVVLSEKASEWTTFA
jgi:hypothetical protein